ATELNEICKTSDQTEWVEGRALSHAETDSYLMIQDAFRDLLGVDLEASPTELAQALQTDIDRCLPNQQLEIYPYLGYMLEVPLDEEATQRVKYLEGESLRQRVLQAVQSYIIAKTESKPLVLVWEDLHWGDPSSLEVLEALLPLTQQCKLLLVLIYRPLRNSRISTFQAKVSQILAENHLAIEIAPLTHNEGHLLLDNLLGSHALPDPIQELIVNKSDGNPFYMEEVIRSLIDDKTLTQSEHFQGWVLATGVTDITIPDTLQGVVMARIDQLNPETKRILQIASVIGRDFSHKVLAQIIENEERVA
ncbi:MAG: AAA family ATPase, partial [Chloroflexota bacterium]